MKLPLQLPCSKEKFATKVFTVLGVNLNAVSPTLISPLTSAKSRQYCSTEGICVNILSKICFLFRAGSKYHT